MLESYHIIWTVYVGVEQQRKRTLAIKKKTKKNLVFFPFLVDDSLLFFGLLINYEKLRDVHQFTTSNDKYFVDIQTPKLRTFYSIPIFAIYLSSIN